MANDTTTVSEGVTRSEVTSFEEDGIIDESHGRDAKRGKGKGKANNRQDTNDYNNGPLMNGTIEVAPDLSVFTDATNSTIQSMKAVQKEIGTLAKLYTTHKKSIDQVEMIQKRYQDSKEQCRGHAETIQRQQITIDTLCAKTRYEEAELDKRRAELGDDRKKFEEERMQLSKDKDTNAKRIKALEKEKETELQKAHEARSLQLDKEMRDRHKEMKRNIQKQADESKQRIKNLETDTNSLRQEIQELKKENEEQKTALRKAEDNHAEMKELKDTYKAQTSSLKEKLALMYNEFALDDRSADYYVEEFVKISQTIESLSEKYFQQLPNEDLGAVHKRLIEADSAFTSIPISESRESGELRIARAQVVISKSLCEIVWQPFSGEWVTGHPKFGALLDEISAELTKIDHKNTSGLRAASTWRSLTTRAIQSLSTAEAKSPQACRAERVVNNVLSILSPLVLPSQEAQFRNELHDLTDRAIAVWESAQTGQHHLKTSVHFDLDQYNNWRSIKFDPLPEMSGLTGEVVPSTRPRIFCLFPRVTATTAPSHNNNEVLPANLSPRQKLSDEIHEVCIHAGIGLPEWSRLVLAGKEEEEHREGRAEEERIRRQMLELENKKKELEARSERFTHSRNNSVVGSMIGLPSPSTQWTRGKVAVAQD